MTPSGARIAEAMRKVGADGRQTPVIRVVHAVNQWLGPSETWLYNQIACLPADRVQARVVANSRHPTTPASFTDVPVSAFSDQTLRYALYRARNRLRPRPVRNNLLETCLRSKDVGVVHSHFGPAGWATARLTPRDGPRQVVTFYGYDVNWLPTRTPEWRDRYRELFARVDVVLCEGQAMAASIEALGCPRAKLRVHHLGVDTDAIAFRPRSYRAGEPLRLLIAARFHEKKGIPDGLRAIGRVRANHAALSVTIVGDRDDSPESAAEERRIEAAIAEADLEDAVSFTGMRSASELSELAYDHHVFVSPSRTARDGDTEGGAPVSIIEMAASGMPVVSTTHCDIPAVLGTPNRALLTPEADAEGLYRQLEELLELSEWVSLAKANRHHIEREYDLLRQSEQLADLYTELVEDSRR